MLRAINYPKLISLTAEEIAYRQNDADFWYYVLEDQDMSSWILDTLLGIEDFANRIGILDEAISEALKIYDFSNSGKDGYTPDLDHIEEMHDYFEDHRKSQLIFNCR